MNGRSGTTTRRPRGHLTAVAGGRADARAASGHDECVVTRGAVRAGDRHEPWTLPATAAVHALADGAAAAGIDFELAARVAVELALTCEDLRAAGVDAAALDRAAAGQRVEGELDGATAAYLRRLTRRPDVARRQLGDAVTVGLPARLSARLLRADLDALLAGADVERAAVWESAAVLAGRTIGEWAPLTALRLAATAPSPPPHAG